MNRPTDPIEEAALNEWYKVKHRLTMNNVLPHEIFIAGYKANATNKPTEP